MARYVPLYLANAMNIAHSSLGAAVHCLKGTNIYPMTNVKQSRDKAQYTRQQKGHSVLKHWVLWGWATAFILPIYYSVSPNHYWHA